MQLLLDDIRKNGVKESIKYVEHNGVKYIVDGHHRYFAAKKLKIAEILMEEVKLPYSSSYRTLQDLMLEGKMPGYWNYLK